MKKIFFILPIIVVFLSCNSKSDHQATSAPGTTIHLTGASLYEPDSIRLALNNSSSDQEAAKKKFLEAIDLYKNKHEVAQGIAAFKASLLLYPSEKTYFELGSALTDHKDYEEALKAFHIAEEMNYSPLARVMYKMATVYAMMPGKLLQGAYNNPNDSMAMHYMEVALQMGYASPGDFLKDKAFDSVRYNNDYYFKSVYQSAMSGNKDPEKLAWDSYKNEFRDIPLPLTINTVWVYNQQYDNAIGYDYEKFVPEMRNGKFSREVENEYFYVGKVKEDSVFTALLYAGKNMWVTDGRGYTPVYFYLVTYNPSGKIIDKLEVGGQKTFTDDFKTLVLKENLSMEVKAFRNIYEKDPEKEGYEKNKVIRSELVTTAYYQVNSNGKIEKAEKMLALKE